MVELLRTKLFIPRPRENLVPRPRLVERLNAGLDKKLALIAAPAGFGKTTLLSEWIPQSPRYVAWLSLDDGDNDSTRFWTYFITSIQQLKSDLGEGALALLQSLQAPSITSLLTTLINDIAALPDAFAVVLDDYHLIDSQTIHEALTYLIAHLPANVHLVMTTRVDPPLPLARLRARDKLTELRANDLRFTADEVAAFLTQVMGLNLSAEEVAAIEMRTEGWIAGLQIAALSMQNHDDISGFIRAFSGSHRHILGYLADEVLSQRPKGTLNFLLQTSILDRLCGPLCDVVTGDSGGQAILESLERANLFITPLDNESRWYRYHHLFAEVLQARLRQNHPDLPVELHRRASEWYETHDLIAEAVQHALAAGELDQAARLIGRQRWALLGRGEANILHRWLDELPVGLLRERPGLSLAYAWILSLLEQPETIEAHLLDAEYALGESNSFASREPGENPDVIRGEIATLRAEIALSQYDTSRAIALCRSALELLPEENKMMRGVTTYFLGHGERRSGNMVEAEQAYITASELGLQTDNFLLALHALANLSLVQISMGRLKLAAQSSQRILEITTERQRQSWPVAGLAYQGLGKLYYEWNDLDVATSYLQKGIEYGHRGGLNGLEINNRTVLAFTLQARNDSNGADQMLREVAVINDLNRHPVYIAQATAMEARLRLRQNRVDQATNWAESCGLGLDDAEWPYSREVEYLTLARVLLVQGKLEGVDGMLDRLQQTAEADRRTGDLIEISIQQALFLCASNKKDQALQLIERALILAEPEGYVRSFIDEGEPVRLLLLEYLSLISKRQDGGFDSEAIRLLRYTDKLLVAFSQPGPIEKSNQNSMIEPLSERELDILRLIATGRSNQEISDILVIALSTVKSHINNLYGKLGTNRRTQAIAIARDMGLLDERKLQA
jgi:LuxR family maltose regulon positive regulatory protein